MLARSETFMKWTLYTLAALACCTVQGLLLQRITLLGVIPFLYPAVATVLSTLEGPLSGAIFSLAFGAACDLALPGPIPCLYTLVFPVAGLLAALAAQGLIKAALPCALVTTALSLALIDLVRALGLALEGEVVWPAAPLLFLRETVATLPFVLPVFLLFRAVYRHCHRYD